MFKKVLIANRGEIAVRIDPHAARDGHPLRRRLQRGRPRARCTCAWPTRRYPIGPAAAAESYLRIDRIIDVAKQAGATRSTRATAFSQRTRAFPKPAQRAGIVFIGPPASAMRAMGNKTAARAEMAERRRARSCPAAPRRRSTRRERPQRSARLPGDAQGRGRRRRQRACARSRAKNELASAWESARSDSRQAFGDDTRLPREGDRAPAPRRDPGARRYATATSCTSSSATARSSAVTRRSSKRRPAPSASPELVARMGEVAVRGAKAVGYSSAGTFEFLLGEDGELLLPRDEHAPAGRASDHRDGSPASIWCARWCASPRVSSCGFTQSDVTRRGAAIECRVYAEDPATGFLAEPRHDRGASARPRGPGVRDDGGGVSPAPSSRATTIRSSRSSASGRPIARRALARMRRALAEYLVTGIRTNLAFHRSSSRTPNSRRRLRHRLHR